MNNAVTSASAGATSRSPKSLWRGMSEGRVSRPAMSIGDLLLVGFEDVVEVGRDWERLTLARKLLRRDVGEELLPRRLVELALKVLGVDARIPVEALDDTFGLHLGAGRHRDEFFRQLGVRRLRGRCVVHWLPGHSGRDQLQLHGWRQLALGHPSVEHVDPHRANRNLAAVEHVECTGVTWRDHDTLVEVLEVREQLVPRRLGGAVIRPFRQSVGAAAERRDPAGDEGDAGHAALDTIVAELLRVLLYPVDEFGVAAR